MAFNDPYENRPQKTASEILAKPKLKLGLFDPDVAPEDARFTVDAEELQAAVTTEVTAEVNSVKADVTGVKADVNGVKSDVIGVTSEVNSVKSEVAGVKADVTGVTAEVNTVKADVVSVTSEVNNVKADVTSVTADVEIVKAEVEVLSEPVQKVVIIRRSGKRIWFQAANDTAAAGQTPLRAALAAYTPGSKIVIRAGYCSVTGTSLKTSLPPGTVAIPEGIVFFEGLDSGVIYSPPELAKEDGNFTLFGPRLNIANFGAAPTASDNADAFDALRFALPRRSSTGGEFGGERRCGVIEAPMGIFKTSREFRIWENCSFGESIKTGLFVLLFKAGYAPASGPEKFGLVVERRAGTDPNDPGASNFTHYVDLRHINVNCEETDNENFLPIRFGAAQTSGLDSVTIGRCKRGLHILNQSNTIQTNNLWVGGPISTGPGLDIFGSMSLSFGVAAVEHHLTPTTELGRTTPTIRIRTSWGIKFDNIQFEATPAGVELINVRSSDLGQITMFKQDGLLADYVVRMVNCQATRVGGISAIHAATGILDQTATVNPDGSLSGVTTRAMLTAPGIESTLTHLGPYYQQLFVNRFTVTGHGPTYGTWAMERTDSPGSTYADMLYLVSNGNGNDRSFSWVLRGSSGDTPAMSLNNGNRGFPGERSGRGSIAFATGNNHDLYFASSAHFQRGIRHIPKAGAPAAEDFAEIHHTKIFRDTTAGNYTDFYYYDGSAVKAVGHIQRDAAGRPYMAALPVFANDAAADADTTLPSGALYKVGRAVFQKP